jgi:hypothetical protein
MTQFESNCPLGVKKINLNTSTLNPGGGYTCRYSKNVEFEKFPVLKFFTENWFQKY